MPTHVRIAIIVACTVLLGVGAATAEPPAVGERFPTFQWTDQHDVAAAVGAEVRYVLFTRDMDGGKVVQEVFAEDGQRMLDGARAVYISDISRMPALVTRMFALPSLRKRSYRVLLDRDGTATRDFPSDDGRVTVFVLADGSIEAIRTIASPEGLAALLAE